MAVEAVGVGGRGAVEKSWKIRGNPGLSPGATAAQTQVVTSIFGTDRTNLCLSASKHTHTIIDRAQEPARYGR